MGPHQTVPASLAPFVLQQHVGKRIQVHDAARRADPEDAGGFEDGTEEEWFLRSKHARTRISNGRYLEEGAAMSTVGKSPE